jgi:hypothetical protein
MKDWKENSTFIFHFHSTFSWSMKLTIFVVLSPIHCQDPTTMICQSVERRSILKCMNLLRIQTMSSEKWRLQGTFPAFPPFLSIQERRKLIDRSASPVPFVGAFGVEMHVIKESHRNWKVSFADQSSDSENSIQNKFCALVQLHAEIHPWRDLTKGKEIPDLNRRTQFKHRTQVRNKDQT